MATKNKNRRTKLFVLLTLLCYYGCINTKGNEEQKIAEKKISYKTHDGYVIEGIVTYPIKQSSDNLPGIVLIHGSAPLDMDASWPAFIDSVPQTYNGKEVKNYKAIAEFLSERGYSVIRVNKRGVKKSLTDVDFNIYKTTSYSNILKDVHSEIEALKKERNVEKIILIGWSEGTILAPKIAEERTDIAGLILMGVVGSSFKELMRHFFDNEKDFQETIDAIENMPDDKMLGVDRPAIRVKELFKDIPNSDRIAKLQQPVLVLHGDIDAETPIEQAYIAKKAIEKNNNPKSKVILYKGFGHGFAPHLGKKGEIKTEGPFDKKVLNDMCSWIDGCFK